MWYKLYFFVKKSIAPSQSKREGDVSRALREFIRNIKQGDKVAEKWMQKAFGKNKGKLRKELGVKEGEKIPAKKLAKAAKSKNPTIRKEVALAKTGAKISRKK